ncbi:MAG: glycoside hydrolase family 99-like domain-containing protein, partial [Acidimicrobiales bacterium]
SRRCQRQGEGRWRFSRLHDAPAVVDYCRVDHAVALWHGAERGLARLLDRVCQLEVALEAWCGPGAPTELREELFDLYRLGFEAFTAKGIVDASASEPPPRGTLLDAMAAGRRPSTSSAERSRPPELSRPRARILAVYLPQFHPVPENDLWWGRGFTEWTNVSRARPLFDGHYQPHLPGGLGFYDLRVPETRASQAALAARHGVEGFCYWHYWFEGRRLLGRPFEEVLLSGQPDYPFCLAWANESWSRRWLGEDRDVLLAQTYSESDDLDHARWLTGAFADRRYVRVEGRPVFLVYRPFDLPDPWRTTDVIRRECMKAIHIEPLLVGVDAYSPHLDARDIGFDATLGLEPLLGVVGDGGASGLKVMDYAEGRTRMTAARQLGPSYRSIFVGWDNSPRRGDDGIVFTDATPERFESGLRELVEAVSDRPFDDRLVFVNAWNEWAEGNHLEPDRRHGLAFLEAVSRAVYVRP